MGWLGRRREGTVEGEAPEEAKPLREEPTFDKSYKLAKRAEELDRTARMTYLNVQKELTEIATKAMSDQYNKQYTPSQNTGASGYLPLTGQSIYKTDYKNLWSGPAPSTGSYDPWFFGTGTKINIDTGGYSQTSPTPSWEVILERVVRDEVSKAMNEVTETLKDLQEQIDDLWEAMNSDE